MCKVCGVHPALPFPTGSAERANPSAAALIERLSGACARNGRRQAGHSLSGGRFSQDVILPRVPRHAFWRQEPLSVASPSASSFYPQTQSPRSCLGAWQTQEGLLFFQAKVLSAYQSSAVPSVAHDDHLTTASKCPDPVQALTPAVTKTGGVSMKTSHKDRNNIGTLPAIMILRSPDVTSLPPGTVLGDNHSRSSLTISVLEEQQPCMS